jgi:type II secretory pathway pseudopilin PulG
MEILVSLAVTAMLLAAVVSTLFGAIRLRRTAEALEIRSDSSTFIRVVVRRDLANCVVPSGLLAGTFLVISSGDKESARDRLEFYSTIGILNEDDPWGDIRRLEYFLDEEGSVTTGGEVAGLPLIRRETFNLLASVEDETSRRDIVMMPSVRGFMVECHDGEAWSESWDSTTVENANPRLVRLTIYPSEGEPVVLVQEVHTSPRPTAAFGAPVLTGVQ